jgi:hypothetical protein
MTFGDVIDDDSVVIDDVGDTAGDTAGDIAGIIDDTI